jgi:penicillin-insensitive murein DD-endopeptidase
MRRVQHRHTLAFLIVVGICAGAAVQAEPAVQPPAPVEVYRGPILMPERKPEVPEALKHAGSSKTRKKEAAKFLFGAKKTAAALKPRSIGWYAKGCLAGGKHLSDAGPAWQTMRPSRNRAWGHPKLIALVERLGKEAQKEDGWPGLLVGDISQPRGGPMISGHASHQVGLDADIWLTPMPDRILTRRERESTSATSMLDKTKLAVNPKVFTDKHVALIKRAANYRAVQRIFVHPAIKKALCERAGKDRGWLSKVRPLWGHHYHFHIRIYCPNGGCRAQNAVGGGDGCGKEVDNWLKQIAKSLKPKPKPKKTAKKKRWIPPSERRMTSLAELPDECGQVLDSAGTTLAEENLPKPRPAATARK